MPLPDFTDPAQAADASLYKANIDETAAIHNKTAGAFYAHEAGTPDMTVIVDAGNIQYGTTLTSIGQQQTTTITAPVTDPRIDRIVIDEATGVYSIVTGTEASIPSAPAIPAGKIANAKITLATSTTAITNSLITDERSYIYRPSLRFTSMSQIGSSLSIAGTAFTALCALSDYDFAFFDTSIKELRTYRFNGSIWQQFGSGLAIAGTPSQPALAAMNSTDVAYLDASLEELRTYRFNGSTWAQVGSSLSIPGISDVGLAALNGTDIAASLTMLDELRTYRFNGSTWAQVGSGLSITMNFQSITALNETDIAFVDDVIEELRTYRFNGSTWSQVGSGLAIAPTFSRGRLAALDGVHVVMQIFTEAKFWVFRFDGSNWAYAGKSNTQVGALSGLGMAAMNATDIAIIDGATEELKALHFSSRTGGEPYRPS
jgi:hypothetical protein